MATLLLIICTLHVQRSILTPIITLGACQIWFASPPQVTENPIKSQIPRGHPSSYGEKKQVIFLLPLLFDPRRP